MNKNNKNRGFTILFKAIVKNFINIIRFYPHMIHVANHPEKYSRDEQYECAKNLIKKVFEKCGIKVEAYGLENISQEDGIYLCMNHQEKFDPLAVWQTFPRQIGVILNDKVTHRPFISEICKLINSKKLIQKDIHSNLQIMHEIVDELKNKQNFMIFPEGYYEDDFSVLKDFKEGSFKSPKRAKCPILPVCIVNSYAIFDKGFKTTRPIEVHYLKPIQFEEYGNFSTHEIACMVRERIQTALDEYQL